MNGVLNFLASAEWPRVLMRELRPFLIVIFAIMGAAGTGYAIYLGFMLAKAEDESKRQAAKKRIFMTVSGLFIITILVTVFVDTAFFNAVFMGTTDRDLEENQKDDDGPGIWHLMISGSDGNTRICVCSGIGISGAEISVRRDGKIIPNSDIGEITVAINFHHPDAPITSAHVTGSIGSQRNLVVVGRGSVRLSVQVRYDGNKWDWPIQEHSLTISRHGPSGCFS
jgi:hypothetical protein